MVVCTPASLHVSVCLYVFVLMCVHMQMCVCFRMQFYASAYAFICICNISACMCYLPDQKESLNCQECNTILHTKRKS